MLLIKVAYFILCALCVFVVSRGMRYGIQQADLAHEAGKRYTRNFFLLVLGWTALISALSLSGFLANFSAFPPRMTLILMPPMIAILVYTIRSVQLKSILQQIPVQWLIYLQSFRVLVELLLWQQYEQGVTPIQMTFEGRNFDILVGLTAPIMAYLYTKKGTQLRKVAIVWNFFGLAMLFNILIIAILSFPTRMRYFMNEPSNYLVAEFPFAWLPGILVTLAYSLHFFSLKQLLSKSS